MKIDKKKINGKLEDCGRDCKELAEHLDIRYQSLILMLTRGSTKNSTVRKMSEFLNCSINEIRKEG